MDVSHLEGIIPALATPFTDAEELDEEALRREVHIMLDAGAHGICVTGSTGEGHTLSVEETCRIATIVRDELGGRLPLIGGIIRDSTRDVVRYGQALREVGVDAIQVTPVHYVFAPTEDGQYAYYERIGREVRLPIIIYNVVPWNTIGPQMLMRLSEIEQVIGVKQSGGDIHKLADLLRINNDRLRIFTAVDALLYPSFMLGAHGSISAILTILPDLCGALWDACRRGDHAEARTLHERILPVWRAMEYPDMSSRTKAAIELRGRKVGNPRHPLLPVTDAVRRDIAAALDLAGVLPARV